MIVKTWLEPVKPMLAAWVQPNDWQLLMNFERTLGEIAGDISKNRPHQAKTLPASEYGMVDVDRRLGGMGCSPFVQALIQFICGYHDLDYRDVAHIGHGRMIALHGSQEQRKLWMPKLASGSLVGIAATEAHGGSRIQATKTVAERVGGGYLLSGEKIYISRVREAVVFVVFFKFEKDEALSAMLIDLSRKGITTETWEPMGLQGWSWGRVAFDGTPFTDRDVLGARGQGMAIFKDHFAYYRPMVAMAALGVAAAVLDQVLTHIGQRMAGTDMKPRDSCLEDIADHYAAINAGMLSALCAIVQNVENAPGSNLWSRMTKAWSVEQAYRAVSQLALLMGATAFRNDHRVAKALNDLRGFLLADGAHDALRRSAGRTLLDLPS